MRFFDAHNHFHDPRLDRLERAAWLAKASSDGLAQMVVNGTEPSDWPAVASLAHAHSTQIIPSFGVHPWKVSTVPEDWETTLVTAIDAAAGEGPVGIGEVGLDRWIDDPDVDLQEEIFVRQLRLATERNLPLTIHCLRAWGPLMDILKVFPTPRRGFLIHSVGASTETIRQLADKGAYFSVSGPFADPAKKKFRKALAAIPEDRLLLETDAPDMLPPESWQAEALTAPDSDEPVCHPANLFPLHRFVAEAREIPLERLTEQLEANFTRFFLKD
jgi:TatD DNase family protein